MIMAARKPVEPTQDLVPQDAEGVPVRRKGDTGLADWLGLSDVDIADDATEVHARIVREILERDSIDDVLAVLTTLDSDDMTGRPFQLFGFHVVESSYSEGAPFYASCDIIFDGKAKHEVWNTGDQAMFAQLVKLREFNQFPYHLLVMATGERRATGYTPKRLIKAD
jgi:hypothetical protein